jgi:thiamine biosynthesis lipoprotein
VTEERREFECFGGLVEVRAGGEGAAAALERARGRLFDAHRRLSRFDPRSELSRLNRDPRTEVPTSPLLRRLAATVVEAGERSGGLVDATLVSEIERAGYTESLQAGRATARPGGSPPPPSPAGPSPRADWAAVRVDEQAGTVIRPPGVRIDGGGLAKGLLADLVGADLAAFASFAVDCCGDLRLGGTATAERRIVVEGPHGGAAVGELRLRDGAVATSGTSKRAWTGPDGRPAHQIIDPASGRPAFTGIVQATAVAPTALLAEVYAKSALLAGPEAAPGRLPFGGILVLEDGGVEHVPATSDLPTPVAA